MNKLNVKSDYPLSEKRPELILTPTGKKLEDINMENLLKDKIRIEDCRIRKETLEYQAQIAESAGNSQIAQNLRRASELTNFDDEKVLKLYSALRPYRSTKEELTEMAEELEREGAVINAAFIREAIEVYAKRKKFKGDKVNL